MDFSSLIIEFLEKHGSVAVSGFGSFRLKKTNAVVDKDGKSILPPGKEITFRTDNENSNTDFAKFVSERKNIPLIDAEIEIKKQVNFWNAHLHKNKELAVENIGAFFLEDSKINFIGNRTENISPDFYGLEEIKFSEIKSISASSYRFSSSAYWVLLLIGGILTITYFGIVQPEKIFGKKSFGKGELLKPLPKVEKDTIKKDSAVAEKNIAVSDSMQKDTLKTAAIIKTPVKKWSSKKYSNSQWKKKKKRRNH